MKDDVKKPGAEGKVAAAPGVHKLVDVFKRPAFMPLFAICIGIAGGLVIWRFPPKEYDIWPSCLIYEWTGLYCPGCGNTRALAALMRGDWLECFSMNALFVPMILCLIVSLTNPKLARKSWFAISIGVVVISFVILRNLPWYPFTLLAPEAI